MNWVGRVGNVLETGNLYRGGFGRLRILFRGYRVFIEKFVRRVLGILELFDFLMFSEFVGGVR